MKLERGHIYEVGDGWKYLRILSCFQEYESFNPDIVEAQYVQLIKVGDENIETPRPFRMKREMFEELVIEDHGFHIPDEPTKPEDSHQSIKTDLD
jgi:hypothetical protein